MGAELYMPPLSLCGDNGAMIACQGYYEFLAGHVAGQELNAVASLPVERGSYEKAPK
jgi:N6-L-threonylcarbamoyladenine synthase